MTRQRFLGRVSLVLAAGPLVLGACSSGSGNATSSVSTPTSGAASTTAPAGLAANARTDVTTSAPCRRDSTGLWVWTGTVTNRSAARHSYRIIVDFTDAAATIEQTKIVTLPNLAPGATRAWFVSGAPGTANTRCVIRSALFS